MLLTPSPCLQARVFKKKKKVGHKEPLWGHRCRHAAATRGIPTLIRLCRGAGVICVCLGVCGGVATGPSTSHSLRPLKARILTPQWRKWNTNRKNALQTRTKLKLRHIRVREARDTRKVVLNGDLVKTIYTLNSFLSPEQFELMPTTSSSPDFPVNFITENHEWNGNKQYYIISTTKYWSIQGMH